MNICYCIPSQNDFAICKIYLNAIFRECFDGYFKGSFNSENIYYKISKRQSHRKKLTERKVFVISEMNAQN